MKRKILKLRKGLFEVHERQVEKKETNFSERERFLKVLSSALELGFSISLPIAGGAILGAYLDKVFATSPKLTLSFIFLGIIIGIRSIFRLIGS